eukprot:366281-Chlamydomonas_euryale.AAC.19
MFMGRGAPRMGNGTGGGGQHSSPTRCTAMTACKKSLKCPAREAQRCSVRAARPSELVEKWHTGETDRGGIGGGMRAWSIPHGHGRRHSACLAAHEISDVPVHETGLSCIAFTCGRVGRRECWHEALLSGDAQGDTAVIGSCRLRRDVLTIVGPFRVPLQALRVSHPHLGA